MSQSTKWFSLPKGWFGPYDNNEAELVATDDDPPKVRGGKKWKQGQGWNLFGWSFGIVRDDERHEEYGIMRGRLAPNELDGAVELILRETDPITGTVREIPVYYMDPKGVHFQVDVHAPNLGAGGGSNELRAPGGIFWFVIQESDGNVVAYRNRVPFDYGTGKPYWSSGPAPAV